jgi:crotonobetainyl-CoA:carnitine CoA-transferase CaiB-like acyl-CoA transferase
MSTPLDGVKVVEVSMWAFVPSAGAALADWGAEVIKVEPPTGDPMRGLVNAGVGGVGGIVFAFEIWNRGKRGIALDLNQATARDIVLDLCRDADVFLTSYLPPTRKKLGIDIDDVRAVNPQIIYACGSGRGPKGPEAEDGGYDSITFWSRGGVADAATPRGYPWPIAMPSGAFGDSLSGISLAGGVAAALAHKAQTGEGSIVDGSLLGTAMWSMQMAAVGAAVGMNFAALAAPAGERPRVFNPLTNNYKTSDDRWIALCMLQADRYWEAFVRAVGRADMVTDPRFATQPERGSNTMAFVEELEATFATKTLEEWKPILRSQPGQWDVIQVITDLPNDPQAVANGFVQEVDYGDGTTLPMFANPVQFDRTPPTLSPAPGFSADTDDVLAKLGWDMDAILEAKISGAVI